MVSGFSWRVLPTGAAANVGLAFVEDGAALDPYLGRTCLLDGPYALIRALVYTLETGWTVFPPPTSLAAES
jgi:hypothetical protein